MRSKLGGAIDCANPINRSHWAAQGLLARWQAIPGFMGGGVIHDIANLPQDPAYSNYARLLSSSTTYPSWKSTDRPGGFGHVAYNGTNNYAQIIKRNDTLLKLQVPLTISAWVNSPGATNGTLFTQYSLTTSFKLIRIFGYSTTEFAYYCSKADGTFQKGAYSTVPSSNAWHFITAVMTGSIASPVLRLGCDGIEQTFTLSALGATASLDMTVPIIIGADFVTGTAHEFWTGSSDAISVWNTPFSSDQIQALYQLEREGMPGFLNRVGRFYAASSSASGGGLLLKRRNSIT